MHWFPGPRFSRIQPVTGHPSVPSVGIHQHTLHPSMHPSIHTIPFHTYVHSYLHLHLCTFYIYMCITLHTLCISYTCSLSGLSLPLPLSLSIKAHIISFLRLLPGMIGRGFSSSVAVRIAALIVLALLYAKFVMPAVLFFASKSVELMLVRQGAEEVGDEGRYFLEPSSIESPTWIGKHMCGVVLHTCLHTGLHMKIPIDEEPMFFSPAFWAFSLTRGRNVSGKCIHIIHGRAPGVVFILVFLHGCHRTVALGGCWDGACCSDCWGGPGDISLQRRVQWKLGIAGVSRLPTDEPLRVMVSLYLFKLQ